MKWFIIFLTLMTAVSASAKDLAPTECEMVLAGGKLFNCKPLQEHRWVVSFFFGNCKNVCPLINAKLQSLYKNLSSNTKILSITVDPYNDKGSAYVEVQKKWASGKPNWLFLTGEPKELLSLIKNGFKLEGGGYPFVHSEKVIIYENGVKIKELSLLEEGEFKKLRTIVSKGI